jgi:hypothetical protein
MTVVKFYEMTAWEQAEYLAYENIREIEDVGWLG